MRLAPALLPTLVLLSGCRKEGDEAAIRRTFQDCVEAVEAGDAGRAAEALAPGFMGPEGLDRAAAVLYLRGVLGREKVGVTVLAQTLEVKGHQAAQEVDVVLTGRTGSALLPEETGRHHLRVRWEKRDGAWRIREVQDVP